MQSKTSAELPTWLIPWLVLIPLHFAALVPGGGGGQEGDEGGQFLEPAALRGVRVSPKLHVLLRAGGAGHFPVIAGLSWVVPGKTQRLIMKNEALSIACTGRS